MKQSRIFAGLLAVLMLAGTSCGGTESQTPKETEQKTGETTAETVTEEPIIDPAAFVPDVFYDDTDFTVLYWNAWAWSGGSINEIAPENVEGGDIINEALLERNRKTEEKLGVRIKAVAAQRKARENL